MYSGEGRNCLIIQPLSEPLPSGERDSETASTLHLTFLSLINHGGIVRTDRFILEQAGLASGLLTEDQIDSAWQTLVESLPVADLSLEEITDQQLSTQLVELGFVNRWQAEQLRQGRTKFTLGSYNILDAIGQGGDGLCL